MSTTPLVYVCSDDEDGFGFGDECVALNAVSTWEGRQRGREYALE